MQNLVTWHPPLAHRPSIIRSRRGEGPMDVVQKNQKNIYSSFRRAERVQNVSQNKFQISKFSKC